jgi:hypothetical protein
MQVLSGVFSAHTGRAQIGVDAGPPHGSKSGWALRLRPLIRSNDDEFTIGLGDLTQRRFSGACTSPSARSGPRAEGMKHAYACWEAD